MRGKRVICRRCECNNIQARMIEGYCKHCYKAIT